MPGSGLKPCPFCGSENIGAHISPACERYIECHDCNTCGPSKGTKADAIEAWNARQATIEVNSARIDSLADEIARELPATINGREGNSSTHRFMHAVYEEAKKTLPFPESAHEARKTWIKATLEKTIGTDDEQATVDLLNELHLAEHDEAVRQFGRAEDAVKQLRSSLELVAEMRETQLEYYQKGGRVRKPDSLPRSLALEKKVDQMLAELRPEPTEPRLF